MSVCLCVCVGGGGGGPDNLFLKVIIISHRGLYKSPSGGCQYQNFSLECVTEIYFFYFSTKTYVVGTQKNHLNVTVLLSTQNIQYVKIDG